MREQVLDPWKCKKRDAFYSDQQVRKGLRLHFCKEADDTLRTVLIDFAQWLRKNDFPIRVNVYFKKTEHIRASDGEYVSAVFFGPDDKLNEPYIRISVGDYKSLVSRYNEFQALCSNLASLAHELTHYYQWLNDMQLSQKQEERQAEYYAEKIVYSYLDERGYDLMDMMNVRM